MTRFLQLLLGIFVCSVLSCSDTQDADLDGGKDLGRDLGGEEEMRTIEPTRFTIDELNPTANCEPSEIALVDSEFHGLPSEPSQRQVDSVVSLKREAEGQSGDTALVRHVFWPGTIADQDGVSFKTSETATQINLGFVGFDSGNATVRVSAHRNLEPIRVRARRLLEDGTAVYFDQIAPVTWQQDERYGVVVLEIAPSQTPGVHSITIMLEIDYGFSNAGRFGHVQRAIRLKEFHDVEMGPAIVRPCLRPPNPIDVPPIGTAEYEYGPTLRFSGFELDEFKESKSPQSAQIGEIVEVEVWKRLCCDAGPEPPDWFHNVLYDHNGSSIYSWQEAMSDDVQQSEGFRGFSHVQQVRLQFWQPGPHELQVFSVHDLDNVFPFLTTSNRLIVNVE